MTLSQRAWAIMIACGDEWGPVRIGRRLGYRIPPDELGWQFANWSWKSLPAWIQRGLSAYHEPHHPDKPDKEKREP